MPNLRLRGKKLSDCPSHKKVRSGTLHPIFTVPPTHKRQKKVTVITLIVFKNNNPYRAVFPPTAWGPRPNIKAGQKPFEAARQREDLALRRDSSTPQRRLSSSSYSTSPPSPTAAPSSLRTPPSKTDDILHGVAHQKPLTMTVFQQFSYAVVYRLVESGGKELPTDMH